MRKSILMSASCLMALALLAPAAALAGTMYPKAQKTLERIFKDNEIADIRQSPVKGLLEAVIRGKDKEGNLSFRIAYVDPEGVIIMFPGQETQGQMLDVSGETRSLTNETLSLLQYEEQIKNGTDKLDFAGLPLSGAITMGKKDAAIKVAVFDDPY